MQTTLGQIMTADGPFCAKIFNAQERILGEIQVRAEAIAESNLWIDWDLEWRNITPNNDGGCLGLCANPFGYKFQAMRQVPNTNNFVVAEKFKKTQFSPDWTSSEYKNK